MSFRFAGVPSTQWLCSRDDFELIGKVNEFEKVAINRFGEYGLDNGLEYYSQSLKLSTHDDRDTPANQ